MLGRRLQRWFQKFEVLRCAIYDVPRNIKRQRETSSAFEEATILCCLGGNLEKPNTLDRVQNVFPRLACTA